MSDLIDFTPDQLRLIEIGESAFFDACPGAGKTQSVVSRFLSQAERRQRQGVALLSFTNAAIDEVRSRCLSDQRVLQAPNFVGTIDSFINRFIVAPVFKTINGRSPSFRDSWDAVHGSWFPAAKQSFQLTWFSFDAHGAAKFDLGQVPYDHRSRIRGLLAAEQQSACAAAAALYGAFQSTGIMDSNACRLLMRQYLEEPKWRKLLRELLKSRFVEVIVDEIQDCGSEDVLLLNLLIESDIRLILVGDLDQSIYGFRGSSISEIRALTQNVTYGGRLNLNFRSSPTICSLVSSIRFGDEEDIPASNWPVGSPNIQVLRVTSFSDASDYLDAIKNRFELSDDEVVVLAHWTRTARACAGTSGTRATLSDRLIRLARGVRTLRDSRSPSRQRRSALQSIQSTLRECSKTDLLLLSDEEFYAAIGLTSRAFKEGCLRLVWRADPSQLSATSFRNEICSGLTALGWGSWLENRRIQTCDAHKWATEQRTSDASLNWFTIHGFKGRQSRAVILAIGPAYGEEPSGALTWDRNVEHENRRVLYVGASRAKELLVLIVIDQEYESVMNCLNRDNIDYELFQA